MLFCMDDQETAHKRIHVLLPADLMKRLNDAAIADNTSKSDYIRDSIELKLSFDQLIDKEWHDKSSVTALIRAAHLRKTISLSR